MASDAEAEFYSRFLAIHIPSSHVLLFQRLSLRKDYLEAQIQKMGAFQVTYIRSTMKDAAGMENGKQNQETYLILFVTKFLTYFTVTHKDRRPIEFFG